MHSLKHNLIFIFLLLNTHMMYGQADKLEEINHKIAGAESDTARIELTKLKIKYYMDVNRDSSIIIAERNIEDSRKIGYKRGEISGLLQIAGNLTWKGEFDKSKAYTDSAKILGNALKDLLYSAQVYSSYGLNYGLQSKYDSSVYYYLLVLDIYEPLDDKTKLRGIYDNLSVGYLMQSKLPEALSYQQKSLVIAEAEGNLKSQAYTLVNMGCTYKSLGDTSRAKDAFLKVISISESEGYKRTLLYAYTNLSDLYFTLNSWEEAYQIAMKADTIAHEIGDVAIRGASLSHAARSQTHMFDFEAAEKLAKRAVIFADESNQPLVIFQTNLVLGEVYVATEKYSEAVPVLKKGIESITRAQLYDQALSRGYNKLSLSLEKTGEYEDALRNYKSYAQINDSVRKSENIRKATELSMTYDFDKEKAQSDSEQLKKDAKTKTNQLMLWGGLLLAVIVAVGGWISFRNKHKANNLLKAEKEKVEHTLTTLKATQKQLIQSEKMASLGELTAGIAHEIQNPLNFVTNFSELNQELIDELELEEAKSSDERDQELITELLNGIKLNMEKINHHGRRADGIVKGMLQHSRKNTGERESIDVNKLTDDYLRLAYHGFRAKDKGFNATIETDFDTNLHNTSVVPQDIGRVFLNLLTNAFYAVNEKKQKILEGYEPTIHVATKNFSDHVEVSVQDNGMGIPAEVIKKIFQPFFTTKPTGQGTGLGLSMSYDIITKTHRGDLSVESKIGEGSKFTVKIPKNL